MKIEIATSTGAHDTSSTGFKSEANDADLLRKLGQPRLTMHRLFSILTVRLLGSKNRRTYLCQHTFPAALVWLKIENGMSWTPRAKRLDTSLQKLQRFSPANAIRSGLRL